MLGPIFCKPQLSKMVGENQKHKLVFLEFFFIKYKHYSGELNPTKKKHTRQKIDSYVFDYYLLRMNANNLKFFELCNKMLERTVSFLGHDFSFWNPPFLECSRSKSNSWMVYKEFSGRILVRQQAIIYKTERIRLKSPWLWFGTHFSNNSTMEYIFLCDIIESERLVVGEIKVNLKIILKKVFYKLVTWQ